MKPTVEKEKDIVFVILEKKKGSEKGVYAVKLRWRIARHRWVGF